MKNKNKEVLIEKSKIDSEFSNCEKVYKVVNGNPSNDNMIKQDYNEIFPSVYRQDFLE